MTQRLVSQTGEVWDIDDAEAPGLLEYGWRPVTPEEEAAHSNQVKYGDQEVKTGVESALDEATFGLSTLAETKLLGVDPAAVQGRRQANPTASMVGGGIGILGTAFVGPGGLLAKGATKAVGAAGLKGLTGRLAASAIEGGFYGAGRAISEDALDGPDAQITAEKLLSHVGTGALFGVGGAAIGEAASATVSKALKKVAGMTDEAGSLTSYFKEKAERNAVRSIGGLGPTSGDLTGLGDARTLRMGRTLLDNDLAGAGSAEIEAARKSAGQGVGAALRAADDEVAGSTVDLAKVIESGRIDIKAPFDMSGFVRRGRSEVLSEIAGDPALESEAREVRKLLDGYAKAVDKGAVTFEEANRFKSNLAKKINFKTDSDLKKGWVNKLRGILDDEIESQVSAVAGPETAQAFREAKSTYGDLLEARRIARKAERRGLGNRSVSLTDYLAGISGAASGNAGALVNMARGAGFSAINNWGRTRGSAVMAKAFDALSKNRGVSRIADAFHTKVDDLLAKQPEVFGTYLPMLSAAAADSPLSLLAAHAMTAQEDPAYRETMAKAGFPEQEPGEEGASYGRALGLSAVTETTKSTESQADSHVQGFVTRTKGPRSEPLKLTPKNYQEHLESLSRMMTNPDALAERIDPGGTLASISPAVATQLATTAQKATEYLYQNAPKKPPAPALPTYGGEWQPAEAALSKYRRIARAVIQPMTVLEDFRRGELSQDAVQALHTVYPRTAQWLAQRCLEKVSESGAKLTHQQRLQLSLLYGQPMDPSLNPDTAKARQQVYETARIKAQEAQAEAQKSRHASKFKPQNYSTLAQRMEVGGQ